MDITNMEDIIKILKKAPFSEVESILNELEILVSKCRAERRRRKRRRNASAQPAESTSTEQLNTIQPRSDDNILTPPTSPQAESAEEGEEEEQEIGEISENSTLGSLDPLGNLELETIVNRTFSPVERYLQYLCDELANLHQHVSTENCEQIQNSLSHGTDETDHRVARYIAVMATEANTFASKVCAMHYAEAWYNDYGVWKAYKIQNERNYGRVAKRHEVSIAAFRTATGQKGFHESKLWEMSRNGEKVGYGTKAIGAGITALVAYNNKRYFGTITDESEAKKMADLLNTEAKYGQLLSFLKVEAESFCLAAIPERSQFGFHHQAETGMDSTALVSFIEAAPNIWNPTNQMNSTSTAFEFFNPDQIRWEIETPKSLYYVQSTPHAI
jgi:hypothetical protein